MQYVMFLDGMIAEHDSMYRGSFVTVCMTTAETILASLVPYHTCTRVGAAAVQALQMYQAHGCSLKFQILIRLTPPE